jgi:hypothetical protein
MGLATASLEFNCRQVARYERSTLMTVTRITRCLCTEAYTCGLRLPTATPSLSCSRRWSFVFLEACAVAPAPNMMLMK